MCDCSSPTIQKRDTKVLEKYGKSIAKVVRLSLRKTAVQKQQKPRETKVIPCQSTSRESWKSWREKLEWRKYHKNDPLIRLDKVNGFLGGDHRYYFDEPI